MQQNSLSSRLGVACLLIALLFILPQCSSKSRDDHIKEGLVYMEENRLQDARHSFMQAIDADPKSAEGYYHLGSVFNVEKKYDSAVEQFNIALRLDPTHFDAHYALGYAHEQMGDKDAAQKEYVIFKRLSEMSRTLEQKRKAPG